MTFAAELASILKTTEKNAIVRAAKMRLLPVCGRCGGCGRYSFNGHHSVCYGCNGEGQRAPKAGEHATVIEDAREAVDSGKLDAYLEMLAAARRTKNARDIVLGAWKDTGIEKAYSWFKAVPSHPEFNQRDRDIADINARMARAYDAVSEASFAKKVDVLALDKLMAEALAEIAAADAEFKAYTDC